MNNKSVALLVGSLSLGALVTGSLAANASTSASMQQRLDFASDAPAVAAIEKDIEVSCGAGACGGAVAAIEEDVEAADKAVLI